MQKTMYRKKVDRRRRKSARTDKKGIAALAAGALALLLLMLGIPGLLVDKIAPVENSTKAQPITVQEDEVVIPVYLSKTKQVEQIPMEQYVMGVVAAEMPIEFELEALKAQALAARTYITRRIAARDFSNVPVENAWVTDTVTHQAYLSQQDLKNKWKDEAVYKANMEKLQRAVNETKGEILLHNNKPIEAFFFSTSNGYTENSEDYWNTPAPYLRSVESPWDVQLSPKYKTTVSFPMKDLEAKLGVSHITQDEGKLGMKVLEQTEGHRVKSVRIGGKTFSGKKVREKLGLKSSQFEWAWKGTEVEITTYGFGHGVGMSQYGADGMAKEGKKAEEIVKYYYKGVEVGKTGSLLASLGLK